MTKTTKNAVVSIKMDRAVLVSCVASAYSAGVADCISKTEWLQIARGAVPGDFVDDNMVMYEAMKVCGISMDGDFGDDDAVVEIWNDAYFEALRKIRNEFK